jgi:thiol-disulfide isomerase/thioredoxin
MSSKHLKLTRRSALLLALLTLLQAGERSLADDFQYFNKGVDYWNELKSDKAAPLKGGDEKKLHTPPSADIQNQATSANEKFPWEQYLDPKNKEFFKEGDYTPPEPFMELVRNPNDENMKMWFTYIGKKNELSARLQERMADYVAKNGLTTPDDKKALIAKMAVPDSQTLDITRYRFRMYFSSTCPHCQKMMGTLSELQAKGFFVEARQTDSNGKSLRLPFPSEMATPSELKSKEIQSVPLLLVGDLKKKVVYRLTGYQTTADVLNALNSRR